MGKPRSTKSLFQATRPKPDKGPALIKDMPRQDKPREARDPLDFDPTPEDATEAFLDQELDFIRAHGDTVAETALGAGHMKRPLVRAGFKVRGFDIVDRLEGGIFCLGSFYDTRERPCAISITNPPYGEINASNGHARWLLHTLDLGFDYVAMLLNADWCAPRINGFDRIFHDHPPSVEYLCCWKIDFRGLGAPPQRNSWFVWDKNRPALGPNTWVRKRLYRDPSLRGQADMRFDQ